MKLYNFSIFSCCNAIAINMYELSSRIIISETCQVASTQKALYNITNKLTHLKGSRI